MCTKNSLLKLEKCFKELKEKETKIKIQFKELKELEEDHLSFKMPKSYYTPDLGNYYEGYGSKKKPRKQKINFCWKNLKDYIIK